MAAVVVGGRGARRQVDVAQVGVGGDVAPDIGVPRVAPRLVQPGVGPVGVGALGHHVEVPAVAPGARVVGPHVARGVLAPAEVVVDRRSDDHGVPHHEGRRPGRRRQPARVLARPRQPRLEADAAVVAEPARGQPRRRVHRGEPAVAGAPDDVGFSAALPVRHPAVVPGGGQGRAALLVHPGVVDPRRLAGARVHRRRLVDRRRQIQPAAGHDGRGRQPRDARPRHPPVGIGRLQPVEHRRGGGQRHPRPALDRKLRVGAAPAPRRLEGLEVVRVDLVQGGVPRALDVARVRAPLPVAAPRLRRGHRGRQADRRERRRQSRHRHRRPLSLLRLQPSAAGSPPEAAGTPPAPRRLSTRRARSGAASSPA